MEQAKLRKYEHALVVSGAGVIAFGAWSVVKVVVFFIVSPVSEFSEFFHQEQEFRTYLAEGGSEYAIKYTMMAIILLALIIDLLLRLYVGRSAIYDGRQIKKKRFIYVIVSAIMAVSLVSSMVFRAMNYQGLEEDLNNPLSAIDASAIVDLTSLLALVEMIIAAIMVRRLRKALNTPAGGQEGSGAISGDDGTKTADGGIYGG